MNLNKAKLILIVTLVTIVASLILVDLVSTKSFVEASSTTTKATNTCNQEIDIKYDEANNDWIISPVSIGFCYTVPESLRTVWNGFFSYPDVLSRFAQTIVKTGRSMTLKVVTKRILESTQTGTLNLFK